MKIIQQPAKLFSMVIGEQKVDTAKQYRLLNFCIRIRHNGINIIYNNLTKELLELSDEESIFLDKNKITISNDFLLYLANRWFLVPVEHNDILLSKQITNFSRQLSNKNNIKSFVIVTTTACNARCFYCFEAGAKTVTMSSQTALEVAKYIVEHCANKKVRITWFGGEPLCNNKVIDKISIYLAQNNVNFSSTMVTNGYLVSDGIVYKATKVWNLKAVQITLDGMGTTYNKVKNYKEDATNPFELVISNIGKLLNSNISVIVRLNMDNYNSSELFELVDFLYGLYGSKKGFAIYAKLLYENMGYDKINHTDLERTALADEFFRLRQHIDDLGILGNIMPISREIKTSFCYADRPDGVLISPEGKLGKCEHYVDSEFFGDIYSNNVVPYWDKYFDNMSQCEKCAYHPTCLRLADCPNCVHGCHEYEKAENLLNMEKQIIIAYNRYLNDKNEDLEQNEIFYS